MTLNMKEEARKRSRLLSELRKQHSEQVKQAQELLKQQQAIRKLLQSALQSGPHSVLQLASETSLPADEVLRCVATMKKYAQVEEAGMDEAEEYYLYQLVKEAEG